MSRQNKKLRFEDLYGQLLKSLETGLLKAGEKISAERDLADQAGISYMTARQAVQALVDKGYLVRKPRVGTFVPFDIKKRLAMPAVNVIMPVSDDPISLQFERVVKQRTKSNGLNANLLKVASKNIDSAIRLMSDTSRPCILLMSDFVKQEEFRQAVMSNPNLILVGYNLSGIGIKSVLCDDAMAARMACTILQQSGHAKIALAISNVSNPVSQQIISGWRSCQVGTGGEEKSLLLIDLGTKNYIRSIEKYFTETMSKKVMPFSAVITSSPSIGVELCQAVESIGLCVGEDVSLVTLGIDEYLPHYTPKLTCVDPHLDRQVEYAVDSSLKMINDKKPQMLHLVTPEIFKGESVKVIQRK